MSGKVELKTKRCTSCGAPLKVVGTEPIECVYCGNIIIPVNETQPAAFENENVKSIKIEGIKTPSSALAYIEQVFEDYDWDMFTYTDSFNIRTIDELVGSLKVSSADDGNTWIAAFKACYLPFAKKIEGCQNVLNEVVKNYKTDNLDAYSKFDAYKRVVGGINKKIDGTVAALEKFSSKAEKFGASAEDIGDMQSKINEIKSAAKTAMYNGVLYKDIKDIPEIKNVIEQKNSELVNKFFAKGIDVQKEYEKAKELIADKKYVSALGILSKLEGYADSAELIDKIDKYYLISNVLEIGDTLYYFSKNSNESNCYSLSYTANGKLTDKYIVTDIKKIVTNFADTIYYINEDNNIVKIELENKQVKKSEEKSFDSENIYVRTADKKAYLVTDTSEYQSSQLYELDLESGKLRCVLSEMSKIISFIGKNLVYTVTKENEDGKKDFSVKVIDLNSLVVTELGKKYISVCGYVDDSIVYTVPAPDKDNLNLYIKKLGFETPAKCVEHNIYSFFDIISGKLFYFVGNSTHKSLIKINTDGSERSEWKLYISEFLFEQGGWLYFIRKSGYNSVLCRSHIDGSNFKVIAADIDSFVRLKNGYLYYIDDNSSLVKVRMDGTGSCVICNCVEKVLVVKEDEVIYTAVDSRSKADEFSPARVVKSIYSVRFENSGKAKLVYDVISAQKYDDNTVYYTNKKKVVNQNGETEYIEVLNSLELNSRKSTELVELTVVKEEKSSVGFAIAMAIMAFCLVLMLIGFSGGVPGLGVIGLLGSVISIAVGFALKANKDD